MMLESAKVALFFGFMAAACTMPSGASAPSTVAGSACERWDRLPPVAAADRWQQAIKDGRCLGSSDTLNSEELTKVVAILAQRSSAEALALARQIGTNRISDPYDRASALGSVANAYYLNGNIEDSTELVSFAAERSTSNDQAAALAGLLTVAQTRLDDGQTAFAAEVLQEIARRDPDAVRSVRLATTALQNQPYGTERVRAFCERLATDGRTVQADACWDSAKAVPLEERNRERLVVWSKASAPVTATKIRELVLQDSMISRCEGYTASGTARRWMAGDLPWRNHQAMLVLDDTRVPASLYLRLAQSQPDSISGTATCYKAAAAARCLAELARESECTSVQSLAAYAEVAPDRDEYVDFLFEQKAGYYHIIENSPSAERVLFQLHVGLLHVFTTIGDGRSSIFTRAFHRERAYTLWHQLRPGVAFPAALLP